MKILVVGAGFAGAVYARELAEAGYQVDVIDRRDHIAGNCYDYVHETGVRVHRYGPHLFHTSNPVVVDWLSRFTRWTPYEHKVKARLRDGREVPLPINRRTLNEIFGLEMSKEEEVASLLASLASSNATGDDAEAFLARRIGHELTETFYRPYTKKMWASDLADLPASVVGRIDIRHDDDNRYFPNDTFQAMPTDGYTALFHQVLNHPNIKIRLGQFFSKSMLDGYFTCFNSMSIDEYFDYIYGKLPYRSIRFHLETRNRDRENKNVTINYTDDRPYTRETWWHNIPEHDGKGDDVVVTIEEPCDFRDNGYERYYPQKSTDGRSQETYGRYESLAKADSRVRFIGRCGTYQYLDMHQVINQSLLGVKKWLSNQAVGPAVPPAA